MENVFRKRHLRVWLVSAVVSAALIAALLNVIEPSALINTFHQASIPLLAVAIFVLCLEGVVTSYRLSVFRGREGASVLSAFQVNAWYVLGIAFLPARLGEAVGVWAVHRYQHQKLGGALSSVFTQRLMDVVVLAGVALPLGLVVGLFQTSASPSSDAEPVAIFVAVIALIVLAVSTLVLARPALVFTPVVQAVLWFRSFKAMRENRLTHLMLRTSLQARLWARHHYQQIPKGLAVVMTLAKWFANILGLSLAVAASGLTVPIAFLLVAMVLYNFVQLIPLPTIGGIGLGEVGVTVMLSMIGPSVTDSASASFVLRGVLLFTPLLFAGLVGICCFRLNPKSVITKHE